MSKAAQTLHPIHETLSTRWSPYVFSERPVLPEDLRSLFEAVRWAASAYNEQPWSYLVATKDDAGEYERLLSCLVEPNQAWARFAPVLALGVVRNRFARNDKPNPVAHHDLGLAAGNLLTEATSRGIAVHQMSGILPDRARELYSIPEQSEALTGLAIGYAGDPTSGDEKLGERDRTPRVRKPLAEFVFAGGMGSRARWL